MKKIMKLTHLGPQRRFPCVDLAETGSDVYGVDFFLASDPGSMRVTERRSPGHA